MPKFIFMTDPHMHNFTDFSTPDEEFITSRFKEQIEAFEKVFTLARENDADVIIGGDIFHRRGSVKTEVYNKVFSVLENNPDIETYIVRGNHDSVTNSLYTSSSIEPFEVLEHVYVFNEPTTVIGGWEAVKLTMLPYGDETGDMKEFLDKDTENEAGTNILVAHIGVDGATQGKHSHRLSGAFGLGDLHPEHYDFILLGHYHKRQVVNPNNPNHFYGGSLMQHNFGDEGQDKGVHLIDTDTKETEFIPINTTQFKTLDGDNLPDNLEEVLENNFVRFVGNTNEVKALENLKETQDVNLANMRVELQKDYNQEARMGMDATMTESEIVTNYAEQKYPSAVDEALECLHEAQQLS